jgi:hypothetical protein
MLVEHVTSATVWDDKRVYEDVLWVLVNSAEFMFVH